MTIDVYRPDLVSILFELVDIIKSPLDLMDNTSEYALLCLRLNQETDTVEHYISTSEDLVAGDYTECYASESMVKKIRTIVAAHALEEIEIQRHLHVLNITFVFKDPDTEEIRRDQFQLCMIDKYVVHMDLEDPSQSAYRYLRWANNVLWNLLRHRGIKFLPILERFIPHSRMCYSHMYVSDAFYSKFETDAELFSESSACALMRDRLAIVETYLEHLDHPDPKAEYRIPITTAGTQYTNEDQYCGLLVI